MEFKLTDLRGGYVRLVKHVITTGQRVSVRGLTTRELTGVRLVFPDTLEPMLPIGVGRRVNPKLAALEALQLISGVSRPDLVGIAAPTFASVLVDATDPDYGAYGPRIVEQLADCLEILQADPASRQAVASIWHKGDLRHVGDKPCTVFMQFLIRKGEQGYPVLDMFTYMRSQDVWLGVPYDIFMFTQLLHTMAQVLRVPSGTYYHHATSFHIYERDVKAALDMYEPTKPLDIDALPMGIMSPEVGTDPFEVAAYLLDDSTNEAEDRANSWYFNQLELIEEMLNPTKVQA